ncbi:hypothetical protein RND81_04G054400 [Saponaria officinalis]|uniref:MPN domain-containing protein n=1 Tax=Saponaria officinalis TaxID=3572 RepID=A0AAW1LCZ1_SAPOF
MVGWYHSHPADISTQMAIQQIQEPSVALVLDPSTTLCLGKVKIDAFRTYPESVTHWRSHFSRMRKRVTYWKSYGTSTGVVLILTKKKLGIKGRLKAAWIIHCVNKGRRTFVKKNQFQIKVIECPQRPEAYECGYYVMK